MPVSQLLATTPASELTEWAAFYKIEQEDREAEEKRRGMEVVMEELSGAKS